MIAVAGVVRDAEYATRDGTRKNALVCLLLEEQDADERALLASSLELADCLSFSIHQGCRASVALPCSWYFSCVAFRLRQTAMKDGARASQRYHEIPQNPLDIGGSSAVAGTEDITQLTATTR